MSTIDREHLKRIMSTPSGPHPVLQILETLNSNPTSSVPAQVLLEYFRNTSQHEVCNVFANFYEMFKNDIDYDVHGADVERSIVSFYLKDPEAKDRGLEICDRLSLDAGIDHNRRTMCRNNLLWYSKALTDYLTVKFTKVELGNTDGYIPLNPSIAVWNDELWMIQRTVNYELTKEGNYVPVVDDNIRTRNWLCKLNDNFEIIEARVIKQPDNWPEAQYGAVLGFEDSRLFVHNNELWTSSTVRELEVSGRANIVVARLDLSNTEYVQYSDWHAIHPTWTEQRFYEKNWMPVVGAEELTWVYSSDPLRIINANGDTVKYTTHAVAADHWRGGSQAIPFKGGWLYCIHETIIPNYKDRTYLHRFVWCDENWVVSKISHPFYFKARGIEFVSGIVTQNNSVIISFGYKDNESYLAEINAADLWDLLFDVINPASVIDNAKILVNSYEGKALLNNEQIALCRNILADAGLPRHADTPKNWDNLISIYECLTHCKNTDPVLDVGATSESAFLPGLYRCGYTNLVSLNLSQKEDEMINGVLFRNGDITQTDYKDEYFGFVACLSVIEHGIDQDLFFKEVYRITKPGARVCISTDYWSGPVDTKGKTMFDTDMVIFSPIEIEKMISTAEKHGFKNIARFDPRTQNAVIHNMDVNYTFAMLVFEKQDNK